jgi:DNA-binding MarR family transcriptional regulator
MTRAEVLERLRRAQRLQSAQSTLHGAAIAARVGINPVDLECLDLLQLHGPLPAGRLAAIAGLPTTTITGVLDRLEAAGFIRRDRGGEDRRVVHIHIEPRALQAIGPHYRHLTARMARVEAAFTDDQLALIARFTEAAAEAVSAAVEDLRAAPT